MNDMSRKDRFNDYQQNSERGQLRISADSFSLILRRENKLSLSTRRKSTREEKIESKYSTVEDIKNICSIISDVTNEKYYYTLKTVINLVKNGFFIYIYI